MTLMKLPNEPARNVEKRSSLKEKTGRTSVWQEIKMV